MMFLSCDKNKNRYLLVVQKFVVYLQIVFSISCFAQHNQTLLINTAHTSEIVDAAKDWSKQVAWLRLLHMQQRGEKFVTQIDTDSFFLSAADDLDSYQELMATIEKMTQDLSIQCRFPARFNWLQQQLNTINFSLPKADCKEFKQWIKALDPERVVLVFASSYLNSPSSMYGHTLMRLDPKSNKEQHALLSYAINFAAAVTPNQNGLLYTFNGLTGGYPGYFSLVEYQKKIKEYTRVDNRDLWEYPIQLNEEEKYRLLAHIWELRDISFNYFFFLENCSYRLLSLLEIAKPDLNLSDKFSAYAIPVDTIRVLDELDLLGDASVRQSDRAKLERMADLLAKQDRKIAIAVAEEKLAFAMLQEIDKSERALAANVALDYWRYHNHKKSRAEKNTELSFQLLKIINRNTADAKFGNGLDVNEKSLVDLRSNNIQVASEKKEKNGEIVRPDWGHKSAKVGLSYGELESIAFSEFSLRGSYHDLMDYSLGYPKFMQLLMGQMDWRLYEGDKLELEQLRVIDIASLSPRNDLFKPLSWRVKIGGRRIAELGRPFGVGASAQFGHTYSLSSSSIVYGLLGAKLVYSEDRIETFDAAGTISTGFLIQHGRHNANIAIDYSHFGSGVTWLEPSTSYNYALSTNANLRLTASHRKYEEIKTNQLQLQLGLYF